MSTFASEDSLSKLDEDYTTSSDLSLSSYEEKLFDIKDTLLTSIRSNDLNIIKELSKNPSEVYYQILSQYNTDSPLHLAASSGNINALKILLNSLTNFDIVTCIDSLENTLLHSAVKSKNLELVEYLLKRFSNEKDYFINKQNNDKNTPILIASMDRSIDIVNLLINEGADFTIEGNDKSIPLHYISLLGEVDLLNIMLSLGSDPNKRNSDNLTPIAVTNNIECINSLINYDADVSVKLPDGQTLLHWSITYGDFNLSKLIISKYPEIINVKDRFNLLPSFLAAFLGKIEILDYLFSLNCDYSGIDSYYRTILNCAAQGGSKETVEYLIKKGLTVSSLTNKTSIGEHVIWSTYENDLSIVPSLIECGRELSKNVLKGRRLSLGDTSRSDSALISLMLRKGFSLQMIQNQPETKKESATDILKCIERSRSASTCSISSSTSVSSTSTIGGKFRYLFSCFRSNSTTISEISCTDSPSSNPMYGDFSYKGTEKANVSMVTRGNRCRSHSFIVEE